MADRGGFAPRGKGGIPRSGGGGGVRGNPQGVAGRGTPSQAHLEQTTQRLDRMTLINNNTDDGNPNPLHMPPAVQAPTAQQLAHGNQIDPREENRLAVSKLKPVFATDFPFRKAFADAKTTVFSNHFAITIDPNTTFYAYEILGIPDKMGRAKVKSLVRAMVDKDPFLKEHQHEFATDYLTQIISWVKFPLSSKPVPISLDARGNPVQLELRFLGPVNTQLLQSHTTAKSAPQKPLVEVERNSQDKKRAGGELGPVINAVNILISTAISDDSVLLKANKLFVAGGHKPLGSPHGSLITMRGYYYTIKADMGQILLNPNACTSAFFRPILVSDFLLDDRTFPNRNDRANALHRLRVSVVYKRGDKNGTQSQTEIIEGTGKVVCNQTFERSGKNGAAATHTTVQAYLKDVYNLELKNPELPAINVGSHLDPCWFAPEHLCIEPYQLYRRPVPDHLTSDMLNEACRRPERSRALIEHEGLKQLGIKAGGGLIQLSKCPAIQIDPRMIQIPSAKLQYPKIQYRNGPVTLDRPGWNLAKSRFFVTRPNTQFKVYVLVDARTKEETKAAYPTVFHDFAQGTYETGNFQLCGMEKISGPGGVQPAMKHAHDKGATFALLILQQKDTLTYSIFKDLADRTYGMHALCICEKPNLNPNHQLKNNLKGYFGNVMMKVNLKAGGINHTVDGIADIMKDTLVLGADVTHPGQSALLGTPSIAAIVGSVDKTGGKFLGSMRLQPKESVEMIKDVEGMVLERIKDWSKASHNELPKKIIYYRDGVGEEQFTQVKNLELPQIRKAFDRAAEKSLLKQKDVAEGNGNCKPGTLVDAVVTSPFYQDFYLQSHNGLKGTAKPAHYFVLANEMGLSEKAMQSFTHKLCYTYVRATLGVSYAPPAYYADRLCERGRCYLRKFFVASPDLRVELNNRKFRLEREKKAQRETKFKPLRTMDDKGYWKKSEGEIKQEGLDKKEIEILLKEDTLEKAKKAFYPGGKVGNPWKERLAGTMFWM